MKKFSKRSHLLRLAHLAGCSFSDLDERHYQRSLGENYKGAFKFLNESLSRECFLTFFYPRICPHCLSENKIAKAIWDLTLLTSCHLHKANLIDLCFGCGQRLSWKRSRTCFCNCGFDLRKSPTASANSFTTCIAQQVSARLNFKISGVAIVPAAEIPAVFWHLSLNGQFALLWLLGRLAPNHATLKNGHGRTKLGISSCLTLTESAQAVLNRWYEDIRTISAYI